LQCPVNTCPADTKDVGDGHDPGRPQALVDQHLVQLPEIAVIEKSADMA
jgi:hypothetical protein